ncbi:MAG TPA: hypothetical protein VGJ28_26670 [Micromonosporaceae bacterium]
MDFDHGAGLLHRLTSYNPDREWDVPVDDPRVRHDFLPNDWEKHPPQVKTYPSDLPVIALPRDLPPSEPSATSVLAGVEPAPKPLSAAELGRVLFLGAGVVRMMERRGNQFLFRAAGSAGGRFPLEVYASTHGVEGVPDGVHWYDPVEHALVQIGPAASGEVTTLVVTGIPWRTGWRYAERGFRHIYWDAGTLLSQLTGAAASAGLDPRLYTLFPDAAVRDLVSADGVHEFPVALVALGGGQPAIEPTGPATAGTLTPFELPLCTEAQRAGERTELAPWPLAPALSDPPPSGTMEQVILRRGSQRTMDRTARLPRHLLEWPMRAAMRGIDVPHWVIVHAVEGVAPGVYRWPDLDNALSAATDEEALRRETFRICLDQDLGGDAAYVVVAAIEPAALDDRGYREAQLAAGLVEGRLHLAAYALGATATGMTFLDSEVPALLNEPDDLVTLLFTCVGVGTYRARTGGLPGAPVKIR